MDTFFSAAQFLDFLKILTSEIFLEVKFVSCVCKEGFGNGVNAIDNIILFSCLYYTTLHSAVLLLYIGQRSITRSFKYLNITNKSVVYFQFNLSILASTNRLVDNNFINQFVDNFWCQLLKLSIFSNGCHKFSMLWADFIFTPRVSVAVWTFSFNSACSAS